MPTLSISPSNRSLASRGGSFIIALAWCLVCPAADHAPGHILVKFKPALSRATATKPASIDGGLNALRDALALPSGATLTEPGVSRVQRAQRAQTTRRGLDSPDLDRFLYLTVPPGLSVDECIRQVARHPWVEYAEPDRAGTGGAIPNDPNFPNQWHHLNAVKPSASIQTPLAWELTQGSSNVIVAVLDTGLSPSAEFAGRTIPGYNFVSNNSDPTDDHGHGTAVAGTVAANANNGAGVAGVDWQCRIMPVKVLDSGNFGFYSWWAQGIDYAVSHGAKVINLSAGGGSSDFTLTRAITNAIAQGVIFVTITHNDGSGTIRFPGNLPEVITVGATDALDRRCGFSNYGPQIDLCAPGTNLFTVSRGGTAQAWWGTSFAAPLTAGVCALLASVRPNLSHQEARDLLCAGAEDAVGDSTDTPGFDPAYGWGRLNAYHSLLLAQTRIDRVERIDGTLRLSWISPANASNRQPYRVEFKSALNAAWTAAPASPSRFAYTINRTFWTEPNPIPTGGFYRVRLNPPL